jgi:hypothetical protein
MKRSLARRITGPVAVAAMMIGALSGCAALGPAAAQLDKSILKANRPKAGSCWASTYKNAVDYANWNDDPPVSCEHPHQLYTFAVVQLQKHHTGKLFGKSGFTRAGIFGDAIESCQSAQGDILPQGPFTLPKRVTAVEFLPTEAYWDAGARWVRCDISVLAVGSPVHKPTLEDLPSRHDLVSEIGNAPDQFRFCVNDPGGTGSGGPKGTNAVYADCRDNPEWRLKSFLDIPLTANAPYPGLKYLTGIYQRECEQVYSSPTKQTYAYYPSANTWTYDGPYSDLECWVGTKS